MKRTFLKTVSLLLSIVILLTSMTSCGWFGNNDSTHTNNGNNKNVTEKTEETKKIIDIPSPVVIPENMNEDEVTYVYASVALDLMSYGYDVFNCVAESTSGCEYGLAYCDYEDGYQFENDEKIYLSSGFLSFSPNNTTTIQTDDTVYLYSIDDDAQKIDDETYGYVVDFCEQGIPNGHFIANGKYVKYSVNDGNVQIESLENTPSNYDLSIGSIYDYDKDEYEFIPYDEITSDPIEYVPLTDKIDGEKLKNQLYEIIETQDKNGYTLESITIAYISIDALNALRGILSQHDSLNGYSFEYLNSLEYDSASQYLYFNEDGTITLKDLPPIPVTETKQLIDWIVDGLVLAGCAAIAVVSMVYLGPAGPCVAGAVVGAGIEYFNQTILQGNKFSDVNWAKVGIMSVSGALGAVVPCSGALGYLGAGLVGGLTSAAMTAVDGGSLEECLISGAEGALTSVITHGLFASCFVAGTQVLTDKGLVAIEAVTVGTLVASYNAHTKQVEYKPVQRTYVNEANELVRLTLTDGSSIVSTLDHPYYNVCSGGYVSAKELTSNSVLLDSNGEYINVQSVTFTDSTNVNVYNFSVAGNHNFFVGESGVLVHNECLQAKRNKAVNQAWKREAEAVKNGVSKYNWTSEEKLELLSKGKVSGYQGHHIIPVNELVGTDYDYLISSGDDIVFLSNSDHSYLHKLGDSFVATRGRLEEMVPWIADTISDFCKLFAW